MRCAQAPIGGFSLNKDISIDSIVGKSWKMRRAMRWHTCSNSWEVTHLFLDCGMDVGIVHCSFQFVGFGSMTEIGLQSQIDIVIGSYKVLLREYSVVGVELHAFQAYVHMGSLHSVRLKIKPLRS